LYRAVKEGREREGTWVMGWRRAVLLDSVSDVMLLETQSCVGGEQARDDLILLTCTAHDMTTTTHPREAAHFHSLQVHIGWSAYQLQIDNASCLYVLTQALSYHRYL
jgi:hypothetical protein